MAIVARELLIALGILLVFLYVGNVLLGFLGLSESSLNISGGVLLFVISMRMVFTSGAVAESESEYEDPFIVPLAMPLVAGPSTIAILLLLSSNQPDRLMEWSIALLLAWSCSTVLLVLSPFLLQLLGDRSTRALVRLMGMILVILATQMLLNGIRGFIESL